MDGALIKELGNAGSVVSDALSSCLGSSMAISALGDLVLLTGQGEVCVTSLRQGATIESNSRLQKLAINLVSGGLNDLRHVLINKEESLLVLWSAKRVVTVTIPSDWTSSGCLVAPSSSSSSSNAHRVSTVDAATASELLNIQPSSDDRIVKVSFHPLCDFSLVVLKESKQLLVFDLRDNSVTHDIPLPAKLSFSSFAFGPQLEWLRFTIFLTTTESEVYCLCPIIPKGAEISHNVVRELWNWHEIETEKFRQALKDEPSVGVEVDAWEQYLHASSGFLVQSFGKKASNFADDSISVLVDDLHNLSIAEMKSDEWLVAQAPLPSFTQLQGPFELHRHQHGSISTQNDSDALSDMCTPLLPLGNDTDLLAPPVLIAAYRSGQVDVLLLDARDDSRWFVQPQWTIPGAGSRTALLSGAKQLPSLLVADSFKLTSSSGRLSSWTLTADPGFVHQFIVANQSTSEAFALSSAWLQAAMRFVTCAVQNVHSNVTVKTTSQCLALLPAADAVPLTGLCVTMDPFVGHVIIVCKATNEVQAVNITMHNKLSQLQTVVTASAVDDKLSQQFRAVTSDDTLRWKHAEKLILKIVDGLKTMPELEVSVSSAQDAVGIQSEAQRKKLLTEAAQLLESNVLIHLRELNDSTAFHMELVKQLYEVQRDVIEGQNVDNSRGLSVGLRPLLQKILLENLELIERLKKADAKYNDQVEAVSGALQIIYSTKPVTTAERAHLQHLVDWQTKATDLFAGIDQLKRDSHSHILSQEPLLSPGSAPTKSAPQTPFTGTKGTFHGDRHPFTLDASSVSWAAETATPVSWGSSKKFEVPHSVSKFSLSGLTSAKKPFNSDSKFAHKSSSSAKLELGCLELSEVEVASCNDLLQKQGKLIEDAKRKIYELQRRIAAAKSSSQLQPLSD